MFSLLVEKCADNKSLRISLLFRLIGKEGDGYTLLTKRLAPGSRFQWPKDADEAKRLTSEQFKRLMEGFTIEGTIHEVYPNLNIENTNRKA